MAIKLHSNRFEILALTDRFLVLVMETSRHLPVFQFGPRSMSSCFKVRFMDLARLCASFPSQLEGVSAAFHNWRNISYSPRTLV